MLKNLIEFITVLVALLWATGLSATPVDAVSEDAPSRQQQEEVAAPSEAEADAAIDALVRPDRMLFNHLDVGLSLGVPGFGIELSTPITKYARLRVGVDYLPPVFIPMKFEIGSYVPMQTAADQTQQYEMLQDLLRNYTGIESDNWVRMRANAKFFNLKMLVDVYPFTNKKWRITAGLYYGSPVVGEAENKAETTPVLMALKLFNHIYDYNFYDNPLWIPGFNNIYIDPDKVDELMAQMDKYGRMGGYVGDRRDNGKRYIMEPGDDGMVRVRMMVNRFKPYLGFGYDTPVSLDGRWKIGFDAGLLFWSAPKLITHYQPVIGDDGHPLVDANGNRTYERLDLIGDVTNVRGDAKAWVDLCTFMKVCPVVNFRVTFNIL